MVGTTDDGIIHILASGCLAIVVAEEMIAAVEMGFGHRRHTPVFVEEMVKP